MGALLEIVELIQNKIAGIDKLAELSSIITAPKEGNIGKQKQSVAADGQLHKNKGAARGRNNND